MRNYIRSGRACMSLKRVNLRVKSTGVYPCFDAEFTIRRHFYGDAERSPIASIAPTWAGTSLAPILCFDTVISTRNAMCG